MKISGWASYFDEPDHADDIVRRGAFVQSLIERPRIGMLFGHDPMRPVGRWDLVEERDKGLWVEGTILCDSTQMMVEQGALFGLSIGYKGRKTMERDDGYRELLTITLLEVSLTSTPCHHRCLIEVMG